MSRANLRRSLHAAAVLLACTVAVLAGGCAGSGTTSVSAGYGYGGAYYGNPWGPNYYYGGGPVYVGPPSSGARPPSTEGRPPQASQLPSRPMPSPRPAGGGGRRR